MSQININNKVFTIEEVERIVKEAKILVDIPLDEAHGEDMARGQRDKLRELIGDMSIIKPLPELKGIQWDFEFKMVLYPKDKEMDGLMRDAMRSVAVTNRINKGFQNLVMSALCEYLYGPVITMPLEFVKHELQEKKKEK